LPHIFTYPIQLLKNPAFNKILYYSQIFSLAVIISSFIYHIIISRITHSNKHTLEITLNKIYSVLCIFVFPYIFKALFTYSAVFIYDIYFFRPVTFKNLTLICENSIFLTFISLELILVFFQILIRAVYYMLLIIFSPFFMLKNMFFSSLLKQLIYLCISNILQIIFINILCLVNKSFDCEPFFSLFTISYLFITILFPFYLIKQYKILTRR